MAFSKEARATDTTGAFRAWFQPPRHWLALFLLIALVPSALLIWFGYRSLRQDSALVFQSVQKRREQAADLIVAAIGQNLAAVEQSLYSGDSSAMHALAQPEGAVTIVFTPGRVEAFPPERLLYDPVTPTANEAPVRLFAAVEDLEFRHKDYKSAIASLRLMAQSPNPAIRSGALIRLARNLRESGQIDAALAIYAQAAGIRDASVSGVPAGLLAQWARCDLLAQVSRTAELRTEAKSLYSGLDVGRWRMDRATYEFHVGEVRRWLGDDAIQLSPDQEAFKQALAQTVEWLWNKWQAMPVHGGPSPGREAISLSGRQMTVLWQGDSSHLTALVATPAYAQHQWIGPLAGLLDRQQVRVALRDPAGRLEANNASVSRRPAGETGLPWTVAVESTSMQGELDLIAVRRRLWLAGLALIAVLVIGGTWAIARAAARELAVAHLQSDFVSAVSHEFRTPLTSLRQLTEILNDDRLVNDDRRRTYYHALARQTERLHRLVESLLDFGRLEAGTSPYRPELMDADAFVRSVVDEFETATSHGFHVELELAGATATIAGDREALASALWNLLDNAVKYSLESRTIWVDVAREDRRLAIRVRDRGLGIPASEQKEIFRRFVRGASAKAASIKGSGIGLAMVQHIVKANGGEIRLLSEPGRGSTFTMLLPIGETCPAS